MRRLGTLVIALLLATAAAAGAGDNIKWERSPKLKHFPLSGDPGSVPCGIEETVSRYLITWAPAWRQELDHIEVLFYSWELHCSRLKSGLASRKMEASAVKIKTEQARNVFKNLLIFYVTVSAKSEEYADLADESLWNVYLERDGQKQEPIFFKINEDSSLDLTLLRIHETRHFNLADFGEWTLIDKVETEKFYRKTYRIAFENPYGDSPRDNVRLVIACDKARRGFEWRFKEK